MAELGLSGNHPPLVDPPQIVVMGVSAVGKSTVAKGLATRTAWTYAEGDAFHPQANIDKMASGHPLTDDDRWPWLQTIRDWMMAQIAAGEPAVVTCSALRRVYRDLLREAGPQVFFVHLVAPEQVLVDRISHREDHFMPASLLHSQFETLEELESDEPGVEVSVEVAPGDVIDNALIALGLAHLATYSDTPASPDNPATPDSPGITNISEES